MTEVLGLFHVIFGVGCQKAVQTKPQFTWRRPTIFFEGMRFRSLVSTNRTWEKDWLVHTKQGRCENTLTDQLWKLLRVTVCVSTTGSGGQIFINVVVLLQSGKAYVTMHGQWLANDWEISWKRKLPSCLSVLIIAALAVGWLLILLCDFFFFKIPFCLS